LTKLKRGQKKEHLTLTHTEKGGKVWEKCRREKRKKDHEKKGKGRATSASIERNSKKKPSVGSRTFYLTAPLRRKE